MMMTLNWHRHCLELSMFMTSLNSRNKSHEVQTTITHRLQVRNRGIEGLNNLSKAPLLLRSRAGCKFRMQILPPLPSDEEAKQFYPR